MAGSRRACGIWISTGGTRKKPLPHRRAREQRRASRRIVCQHCCVGGPALFFTKALRPILCASHVLGLEEVSLVVSSQIQCRTRAGFWLLRNRVSGTGRRNERNCCDKKSVSGQAVQKPRTPNHEGAAASGRGDWDILFRKTFERSRTRILRKFATFGWLGLLVAALGRRRAIAPRRHRVVNMIIELFVMEFLHFVRHSGK